jgi:hypothetical protein
MVNLITGFPIWRYPIIFMDVVMWQHHTFGCKIFRHGEIYYSISTLSLLTSCKLSFQIVGLKMFSLPTLILKSHNQKNHMVFREFIQQFQLLIEAVLHIINFIFRWDMNIQNNMPPATS